MSNETRPKIENLPQDEEELTPEQRETEFQRIRLLDDDGVRDALEELAGEGEDEFDPLQYVASNPDLIATIGVDEEAAPMVVPLTAVTEIGGAPVVFVVDPAKKVVRITPVVLDGTTDGGIRIAGGLQAGDTVVSAGVQFLSDGMRVKLPGEQQP